MAAEIRVVGAVCTLLYCGVSDPAQVTGLAEQAIAAYRAVYVLVNNAGVLPMYPVAALSSTDLVARPANDVPRGRT